MMAGDTDHVDLSVKVQKVIPLTWFLAGGGGLAMLIISLVMTVSALTKSVDSLEVSVKSGNASVQVLTAEMALMKFRMDTSEFNQKRTDDIIRGIQAKR